MSVRSRPHVAIDVRMANDSGIGTYIRNVVPRIVAARPHWRVTLLGRIERMRTYGWDQLPNVTLVDCRSGIYTIAEQFELWRRTPRGVDLFWSPHYNIPLLHRGRLVVTVHDLFHLAMRRHVRRPDQRAYARLMFEAVARRSRGIICISEFTRGELMRLLPRLACETPVVHNGVDPVWSTPVRGERPHRRPYVLFVGNIKPHKNVRRLVDAFGRIMPDVPHDLVIVGRREGMRTIDTEVVRRAETIGDRVTFTGELDFDDLRTYVASADVLVAPSLYEGFGLPPLEAMAAGCPTLVARAASLPEVCGDAALYCDPLDVNDMASRLLELLRDARLRDELRARGRAQAARFTWEACARGTLGVLEGALA